MWGVPAVAVTRGERIESVHAVAACACTADGAVRLALGAIDEPIFLRSTAKPFIAAAVVRAGAAERFGFTERELATAAASHAGEPGHVATVRAMLAKIGAVSGDLEIPVEHNCSGKHAALLALARVLDAPLAGYREPAHPAQRHVLAFLARAFGEPFAGDRVAVDGCGVPIVAVALRTAARAFARFGVADSAVSSDEASLARVRDAMRAQPWSVAGTGRLDTALMEAGAGAIVAKGGAEAVHGTALPAAATGLVLKVVDGNPRAVGPAAIALLDALGALAGDTRAALEAHATLSVRNVSDRIVGSVRALRETSRFAARSESS